MKFAERFWQRAVYPLWPESKVATALGSLSATIKKQDRGKQGLEGHSPMALWIWTPQFFYMYIYQRLDCKAVYGSLLDNELRTV